MAKDHSFDIVSKVNETELANAIAQVQREISQRFDFRGTSAGVSEYDTKEKLITVTADNEPHLEAVLEVLRSKMTKRGVDARTLDGQKIEAATHKTLRQKFKLKQGVDRESAKKIQTELKALGLKLNVSIQGEALRVASPKLDDLQAAQAAIKAMKLELPVQFDNYR